jgi:Short C-terminal domain
MSQQRPIRVVVERKGGCLSGCGTALAVLLLLGLTIQYWYVALPIVLIVALAAISNARTQRKKAAHQPGPRDPWLNEVAVALADLGLEEIARNTGTQLGGAPIDGDIGLQTDRFLVYVTLFSDKRLARQAELGLRAKPEVRDAIAKGRTAVRTEDRVVFVANGRGTVVDEFRLDEVVRVVDQMALPAPLQPALSGSGPRAPVPDPDALEQLRNLGDLHQGGVLTDAEFEAMKAEMLRRL